MNKQSYSSNPIAPFAAATIAALLLSISALALARPIFLAQAAPAKATSGPSIDLAASYPIIGYEPIFLSACTDPEDDERIIVTSRTLSLSETTPGSFTGSMTMTGLNEAGAAVGGTFAVSGTAAPGNPRSLVGTMETSSAGLTILNGAFSGSWEREGGVAKLTVALSGRGTTDGKGSCAYSASLPMANWQASPTSDLLTGVYNAEQNTIAVACPDPLDNDTLYPQTGTLSWTEASSGTFDGQMSLSVLTKTATASGGFALAGTSAPDSQTITGTIAGTEIFSGSFSGTSSNTGSAQIFTLGVSGTSVPDPAFPDEPPCTFTGSIKMAAPVNIRASVTTVDRTYPGFFLRNDAELQNTFAANVDWKGLTPGKVRFQINDLPYVEVNATVAGANKAFNMTTDFPASMTASELKITPITSTGALGLTRIEKVYVFTHPTWLREEIIRFGPQIFSVTGGASEVKFRSKVKWPDPEFKGYVQIPARIPILGGKYGIDDSQLEFTADLSSLGTGTVTAAGRSGVVAGMKTGYAMTLSGSGQIHFDEANGAVWDPTSFKVIGTGSQFIQQELGEVVPKIKTLGSGFSLIKKHADKAARLRIRGELTGSVDLQPKFKQDLSTGKLKFESGSGQILSTLGTRIDGAVYEHISLEAWVSGGGGMTIAFPAPYLETPFPYVQSMDSVINAGYKVEFDGFFGSLDINGEYKTSCKFMTTEFEVICKEGADAAGASFNANKAVPRLNIISRDYGKNGAYGKFVGSGDAQDEKIQAGDGQSGQTLITNLFPKADPVLVPAGSNGKMVVYVNQNPNLPTVQSTDINWTYFNGNTWSQPQAIQTDTRAEMSPVAGVTGDGRVVAAWIRNKVTAFDTPLPTVNDLPLFYRNFEVVTATFDPVAQTWGPITVLTDDLLFDTNLRLVRDGSGSLMLSWQSNPSGAFNADSANPGTLKASFWSGGAWSNPQVVANDLINADAQSGAVNGSDAVLVVPQDPNLDVLNDEILRVFRLNGGSWSAFNTIGGSGSAVDLPVAYFDNAGNPKLLWRKGTDLLQGDLSGVQTKVIRPESDTIAVSGARLVDGSNGRKALLWEEVVEGGPTNIYGMFYNRATDSWGVDQRLTTDDWGASATTGYLDASGRLQMSFLATKIDRVTRTVQIDGEPVEIPNFPVPARTDLRFLDLLTRRDTFPDFDGDGKADVSVFRSESGSWYVYGSQVGFLSASWGAAADVIAPADFDGDGKTDYAVFRDGTWLTYQSSGSVTEVPWGAAGDRPVPADYDGDGRADQAVYRDGTWWIYRSTEGPIGIQWGNATDIPVPADYDGDGKTDVAIVRDGVWWIYQSTAGPAGISWGQAGDKPVPADYDGDGKTDVAIVRDGIWWIYQSTAGPIGVGWGNATDIPVPADYDGDGKADVSIFRDGTWWLYQSTAGPTGVTWGVASDIPIPKR